MYNPAPSACYDQVSTTDYVPRYKERHIRKNILGKGCLYYTACIVRNILFTSEEAKPCPTNDIIFLFLLDRTQDSWPERVGRAGRVAGSFLLQHEHAMNSIEYLNAMEGNVTRCTAPSSYLCSSAPAVKRQFQFVSKAANISKKFCCRARNGEQGGQSPGRRSRDFNFYTCTGLNRQKKTPIQLQKHPQIGKSK